MDRENESFISCKGLFILQIENNSVTVLLNLLTHPLIPVILDKKILAIKRKLRLDDNLGSLDFGEKKTFFISSARYCEPLLC